MKILHFADVHLGRGFSGYAEVSEELSEARYETLENLISKANEKQCDVIVIAGDLFERPRMNKADVERVIQILNRFERGPVLLLPGNHDYVTPESDLWRYVNDAKDDHVIVLGEKAPKSLGDYDLPATIYPAPCHSKHSSENEIGWIADVEKDSELINIGIAHGSVPGVAPDMNDEHYPMTQEELSDSGVDLWLLGHIHVPWPDNPGQKDRILYSGTPEPDTANCPHGGTALLVEIGESKEVYVQQLLTGKYRFENWDEHVTSKEELENLLQRAEQEESQEVVCRLTINGKLEEEACKSWHEEIFPKLREAFFYLKLDDSDLKRRITKEQVEEEFPQESFPDRLLSRFIENDQEEALQTAYELISEVQDEN
ncbi:metallophosphoesterase [Fodinibius sediminis]|uniref:DNA repair exonuclease SbcCD nuclease subunit n=1 Tax=Fodinibius sediminis TaxID=1214077 RepID=A0A521AUT8_9BACT|nr:metallophosphoesterase [Fodinibius sediminis]SMO38574.1 DNA repair exonuclease SbcCD nuclease subunit [Fodinibius sediminis]